VAEAPLGDAFAPPVHGAAPTAAEARCEASDVEERQRAGACLVAAGVYRRDRGPSRDPARAAALYARAYDLGAQLGCEALAEMVAAGGGAARTQRASRSCADAPRSWRRTRGAGSTLLFLRPSPGVSH
jgi:TPR repeat protein